MARFRAIFVSGALIWGDKQMSDEIRLIVGLGNPGKEYEHTRHNAGFWFVDELAREYGGSFKKEGKFFGEACRINLRGSDCWLLKPVTFMNRSGQSVSAMASYYKIASHNILVAHDELDHDAGSARLKYGGGHAGHNGLRDIISALGSKDFLRLRLGVGHPGSKNQVVNYVLGNPSRDDANRILDAVSRSSRVLEKLLEGKIQIAMNEVNSS